MAKHAVNDNHFNPIKMEFRKIIFKNTESLKIYDKYMEQINSVTKKLSETDRQDILMEMNSHIYESLANNNSENDERISLLAVLDKLGDPKIALKPLIAEKKLNQATRTFNPVHVFQAIVLNLSQGLIYVIFFILYIFLLAFGFLIVAKIFYPDNFGFFYKKGVIFQFGGYVSDQNIINHEILGNWFFPVTFGLAVFFYVLITLFLKLNKILKRQRHAKIK